MIQRFANVVRCFMLLFVLVVAACGKEAPPRSAAMPTSVVIALQSANTARPTSTPQPTRVSSATRVPSAVPDPRALGDPNAPITIVEYSDFQCPFCAEFVATTKPLIENEYIKTGRVYYIHRDFPLDTLHPGARQAAQIARCAADQGRFWDMHDRLFHGQRANEWGSGGPSDLAVFWRYAGELKLDTSTLQQCVESQKYAAAIEEDVQAGLAQRVAGTPSFFVNGQPFIGAQPIANWRRLLDGLLPQ